MAFRSLKSFEQRWIKFRKLAAAQLKDLERDRKQLATEIRRYKLKRDLLSVRDAVAHSKKVDSAIKVTKKFVKTKDKVVKQAKRRGRLLRRAFS